MTTKTKSALEKSIAHWERMIKFVKTQPKEDYPYPNKMISVIGETWSGKDCALCGLFSYYGCKRCPLNTPELQCDKDDSPYDKVANSTTWEEWLENAQIMLNTLKEVKG